MSELILTVFPSCDRGGEEAYSQRGQLFDGAVDGCTQEGRPLGQEIIVERSTQPLLDACRALLVRGIDPRTRIVMRHAGSTIDALKAVIGNAAKLTVAEGNRPPHFVHWTPHPMTTSSQ